MFWGILCFLEYLHIFCIISYDWEQRFSMMYKIIFRLLEFSRRFSINYCTWRGLYIHLYYITALKSPLPSWRMLKQPFPLPKPVRNCSILTSLGQAACIWKEGLPPCFHWSCECLSWDFLCTVYNPSLSVCFKVTFHLVSSMKLDYLNFSSTLKFLCNTDDISDLQWFITPYIDI